MPEFKLQRLRGGYAFCVYDGGKRISRVALEAVDPAGAAAEFERHKAAATRPVNPTVAEVWTAYRADKKDRRIAANMEWSGKAVLPFFGEMKPEHIGIKECREYATRRRLAGRKPGTIGTELNHLRTALKWAKKANMIDAVPGMELPRAPEPKERHLTRAEFEALLAASETPHLRLFLILALSTGGRKGALFDLTWDRVDFDRGLIFLGHPTALHTRKGRATVPMTNSLRAALQEARQGARTRFVLEWGGEPIKSVRTALDKAAARAGIEGVSPHVLRHTAAVWMAEAGRPMTEIAAYLGHRDSLITERVYARFSPEFLRQASGALELGSVRRFTRTPEPLE